MASTSCDMYLPWHSHLVTCISLYIHVKAGQTSPHRAYAYYRKTSLKADREDWGGLLKTPAKHRENERQRDHSHRGARGTKGTNEIP